MPFTFNGNTPETIVFNGNDVMKVVHNGTTVWEKAVASVVTLYATDSFYCMNNTVPVRGETVRSPSGDTGYVGYACVDFPPHSRFASFTKATLHMYFTRTGSTRVSPMVGTYSPSSYTTNIGSYTVVSPSAVGWFEMDITARLQTILAGNANFPDVGLKVYLRRGNSWISSHTGEYPPYIVLE